MFFIQKKLFIIHGSSASWEKYFNSIIIVCCYNNYLKINLELLCFKPTTDQFNTTPTSIFAYIRIVSIIINPMVFIRYSGTSIIYSKNCFKLTMMLNSQNFNKNHKFPVISKEKNPNIYTTKNICKRGIYFLHLPLNSKIPRFHFHFFDNSVGCHLCWDSCDN